MDIFKQSRKIFPLRNQFNPGSQKRSYLVQFHIKCKKSIQADPAGKSNVFRFVKRTIAGCTSIRDNITVGIVCKNPAGKAGSFNAVT